MKKLIILLMIVLFLPSVFSFKYLDSEMEKSNYYTDEKVNVRLIVNNPTSDNFRGKIRVTVVPKDEIFNGIPIEYDVDVPKGKEYVKTFNTKRESGEYYVEIGLIDFNGMIVDSQRLEFRVLFGERNCEVNGFCGGNENYGTCPIDCKSGMKDDYCDRIIDGICDPDCEGKDLDCKIKEREEKKILTSFLIILFIIVIMFYILKLKKKGRRKEKKKKR